MSLTRRGVVTLAAACATRPVLAQGALVRPRIIPPGAPLRGMAVTPPTYWPAVSSEQPPHYRHPPYSGTWDAQNFGFPPARRAAARAAGFNVIRSFVDAGPFMDAARGGALNTTGELLNLILGTLQNFVAAGFRVILNYNADLRPPNPDFARGAILDGPEGRNFRTYAAGLAAVAAAVAGSFTPDQVGIEIINEPLYSWEWGNRLPWSVQAPAMWRYARAAAPDHTLVVQSRSAGYYGALPELDPGEFDANTLFCFHPYDPGGFTHQGIGDNVGLYRIPFPVEDHPDELANAAAVMRSRVAALSRLTADQQHALIRHHEAELANIYVPGNPLNAARIDRDWRVLNRWLERYRLPPIQVLAGEFGVTSDFNYNGSQGCDLASRARFYGAIRETVERRGFAGWIAWQSVGDFNLFQQASVSEHSDRLIPEIIQALGLTAG